MTAGLSHSADQLKERLDREGYLVVPDVLTEAQVEELRGGLERLDTTPGARLRDGSAYGARDVLSTIPEALRAAESLAVRRLVEAVLGPGAFPIHARFFDKTAGANWKVGWHQDLIIPVREHKEVPGFTGWSVKAGTHHVHPPAEVLNQLLAVRLHLDDCGPDNGPLRIVPGSHLTGKLSPEQARARREQREPVTLTVLCGGAILMRPLLLHTSSPAAAPAHRRVLHVEYVVGELPGGLEWPRAHPEAE